MSAPAPSQVAQQLFAGLGPRYDVLAEVLSFGQNRRWRRAMVDAVIPSLPGRVLDVATGTAGVALQIAARSGARVTGVDLSTDMLRTGAARASQSEQADRVNLLAGSAEALPFPDESFDALSFTYLLRYVPDPAATLRELLRVLKPGGVIANLEFALPESRIWRPAWALYTRLGLPLAGLALGSREWYEVGKFLGPSISSFYRRYPLAWQVNAWREAGARDLHTRVMSLGGGLVIWGRKARRPEDGRS